MTNKEAIAILKPLFEQCKGTDTCLGYIEHFFSKDEETALDIVIKALEEKLQGEWITNQEYIDKEFNGHYEGSCFNSPYNCSCCGYSPEDNRPKYCPNCGADMRGDSAYGR